MQFWTPSDRPTNSFNLMQRLQVQDLSLNWASAHRSHYSSKLCIKVDYREAHNPYPGRKGNEVDYSEKLTIEEYRKLTIEERLRLKNQDWYTGNCSMFTIERS